MSAAAESGEVGTRVGEEDAAKAESMKNKANEFFKCRCAVHQGLNNVGPVITGAREFRISPHSYEIHGGH